MPPMSQPNKPTGKPGQVQKSGLAAKLGKKLDDAVKEHAQDETSYGIIPLPPGIPKGIAKLVTCGFGQYKDGKNKGEYFFRAAGVVLEPYSIIHNGMEIPVAGLQTSVMIPVCDTTDGNGKVTPVADHIARVLNEMRKLGGEDYTHGASASNLEALAKGLEEAAPYFWFATSVRKARNANEKDGVWENWNGTKGLETYVPPDLAGAVQDDTGEPTAEDAATEEPPSEESSAEDAAPTGDGEEDLNALAELADAGIANAQSGEEVTPEQAEAGERLKTIFLENGHTEKEFDAYTDYASLVAYLQGGEPPTEEAPEEPAPFKPEKGRTVHYQLVDAKTGKPLVDLKTKKVKKPVECEIIAVDAKTNKVDLRNLTTKAVYKGVPVDKLITEPF